MGKKIKVKIGDLFEICTSKGFAYAQYSHHNALCGALIRVLPGLFDQRPDHLRSIVTKNHLFVVFFPVQEAVDKHLVEIVGNYPIPVEAQQFPLFRAGAINVLTGTVKTWWLWDGDKEWKVERMSPEEMRLPLREIVNDTLLIEKIESCA